MTQKYTTYQMREKQKNLDQNIAIKKPKEKAEWINNRTKELGLKEGPKA